MMKSYPLIALLLFCLSCNFQGEQADLIVHNAVIYTVNENFSLAQAMAIKDGKIVAIGAEREILNKYAAKEMVDAMKRPVYPGFIDAHCHFMGYGESLQKTDLSGTKSFDEVIERVVKFKNNLAASDNLDGPAWIVGRGWDQNDWPEKQFPDKRILDSLFPATPVFLKRIDGHAALANSEALTRAGITANTKISGGWVEVKNNEPTGILIDNAVDFVSKHIPEFSREQKTKALLDAQQNCFAVGLTTVDDAGLNMADIRLMEELHQAGKLKMRVYAMLDGNTPDSLRKWVTSMPLKTARLTVRSVKFFADGSLGSRGALLLKEYADKPGNYGLAVSQRDYIEESARMLYEKGWQVCTHAIGDSAVRMMVNLYAGLLQGTNDKRWRIEHAQVVSSGDLEKFSQFNIIPSVQPTHATSDMYWAEERLGKERLKTAYAYKNLFEQNGMIALGTDFPVEHISPLKTFYAAVFRKDENGFPADGFQMENALDREAALKGMTIFAAIANFEEQDKGSLEPGKYADFVISDTDIMLASPEQILKAKILSTFINGEKVF